MDPGWMTPEAQRIAVLDHIIPLDRGGPDDERWNHATACNRCNSGKSARLWTPMRWNADDLAGAAGVALSEINHKRPAECWPDARRS
jgi:hypothetical protein